MPINLDPFQSIDNVSWVISALAENVGYVDRADQVTGSGLSFWKCQPSSCPLESDFLTGYYNTRFIYDLRSDIQFCDQFELYPIGRSSGKRVYTGWDPELTAIGLDCNDICPGSTNQCMIQVPNGDWVNVQETNNAAVNGWNTTTKRYRLYITFYTVNTLGYTLSERLDLELGTFTKQIVSIEQRTSSTVWVYVTAHGFPAGAYITIAGTENYDGTYEVNGSDSDRFWINKTWVEDESTGTIAPNYTGP